MKKGTLIAIGVLLGLLAVFFLTRESPQTKVAAPHVIKRVEGLARIELTRPLEDGKELVVLEKSEDVWQMTKPVESPLATSVLEKLEVFNSDIRTDDLRISADKVEELGLGEDVVTVALYTSDGSSAAREFGVGQTISVENTGAKRTFILSNEKPYRAQAALDFLKEPVSELRSKEIFKSERELLTEFVLNKGETRFALRKPESGWELEDKSMPIENSVVSSFVNTLTNLNAVGFSDKSAAEVGLEPPQYLINAKFGESFARIALSQMGDEYFAQRLGNPTIYKISKFNADTLMLDELKLRNRVAQEFDTKDITAIEFAGEDRVVLSKSGEEWTTLRPERKSVNQDKVKGHLTTISRLRASRFENVELGDVGLGRPEKSVIVRTNSDAFELLIGSEVEGSEDVWAKWKHQDLIWVMPKFVFDKLEPKISDFEES